MFYLYFKQIKRLSLIALLCYYCKKFQDILIQSSHLKYNRWWLDLWIVFCMFYLLKWQFGNAVLWIWYIKIYFVFKPVMFLLNVLLWCSGRKQVQSPWGVWRQARKGDECQNLLLWRGGTVRQEHADFSRLYWRSVP